MSAVNSSVPTISVTPHSPAGINIPAVNKQYSILEDNLKQLHDIVEAVQHMKDANILKIGEQCMRLSCSCPSLSEFSSDAEGVGNSATSSPSHIDLSSSMSTPYISISSSSGIHLRQREFGEWKSSSGRITSSLSSGEILRRRSWAALEDLSTQGELDRKISKQRSASLSSLESDTEDIFLETDNYNNPILAPENTSNSKTNVNNRNNRHGTNNGSTISNISTHSLNEADLLNDFNLIRSRREEEDRLLQARLPLQKSVSTPSIIAVATRDSSSNYSTSERPTETVDSKVPNENCYITTQRPSGTESETEEEMLVTLLEERRRRHFPFDQMVLKKQNDVEKSSTSGTSVCEPFVYDDRPEKRRKRGSSLFFRKKKEKVKKSNGTHLWVNTSQGNSNNVLVCDWCSKPVIEAKYAKCCGGCQSIVHQGLCIQHMTATECHQKGKSAKLSSKSMPAQNLMSKSNNKKNSYSGVIVTSGQNNRKSFASATLCYSPWRRVASKLGVNPIINEEKEETYFMRQQPMHEDHLINYSEEVPLVSQEFLNEEQIGAGDLDTDPFLGLQDDEPDTWSPTVNKEILKKLKEKEIKRQEHIYEFVLTEKHHCLTLILMQKIFVDGLKKHFQMDPNLPRMFPRLAELTDIHLKFLHNLRKRQKEAQVVETISDILLEQFSGNASIQLKAAYGEFCSRHRDAVEMYKCYLLKDPAFAAFVKHCQNNPLLKKKGIPECILFVTQRLTKYPLLIEPLIKTSKENKMEVDKLTKALALVRDILTDVDSRVAEKEKEDRKLEIYYKTDAKSFTMYRGKKFKKSDILSNNRKLRFEGQAHLMQGRTKSQLVHVIVLSDILLFLVENNNKFSFFTPDGKAGVVCLQKLLVRELAGNDSKSIFLISSNPSDPEMFELKIQKPKEKAVWIDSIRDAVQHCPEYDQFLDEITQEEKQRRVHISEAHMQQIVGSLRQKDVEQALIYEEKISLLLKLFSAAGVDVGIEPPSYCHLVSQYLDNDTVRKEVFNTIQKVNLITSSLYNFGTNLSRSASSVGERQSNVYVSPLLPKRAETFGGFDNAMSCKGFVAGVSRKLSQQFQKKSPVDVFHETKSLSPSLPSSPVGTPELVARKLDATKNISPPTVNITLSSSQQLPQPFSQYLNNDSKLSLVQDLPTLLQMEAEQQSTVVQLTSHIYTLASIIAQQMSSIDSLEAQLAFCRQELNQPSNEKERKPIYKHNQQLEELRNLQDKLTQEKEQWQREKETEEKDLEEKRKQLQKLQEQVKKEQEDISLQREQLYRKLEAVSCQGLVNAANPPLLTSPQPGSQAPNSSTSPSSILSDLSSPTTSLPVASTTSPSEMWKRRPESVRWKPSTTTSGNILPLNLISATNQQKAASNVQVKQKLPLKLATKLGSVSSSGGFAGSPNISSSNSFSAGSPSPSLHSVGSTKGQQPQQIIPRKLCETNSSSVAAELRRSCSSSNNNTGGYERLVSESTGSSALATSPPSTHSNNGARGQQMQQILPMKLRETNSSPKSVLSVGTSELKRSVTTSNSGYERLVSTETLNTASSSPPTHSRTGSSPAMMQNIRVSPPTSNPEDEEKTNTYPKALEKNRASIAFGEAASKNSSKKEEEKVIFF